MVVGKFYKQARTQKENQADRTFTFMQISILRLVFTH